MRCPYELLDRCCRLTRPQRFRKGPEWTGKSINQGDDIAGIVHAVGDDVVEFKPGDRVAALHPLRTPGGSYAEYAVSPAYTTFHLPKKTSFEGKLPALSRGFATCDIC
jgi:NADPH:quinone reductase